jgi:hypothetical protein
MIRLDALFIANVGGVIVAGCGEAEKADLEAALFGLAFGEDDYISVDSALAGALQSSAALKKCEVIGASVNVAGFHGPTGGVLGDPNDTAESSDGLWDARGAFKILAYPGGPGLALFITDQSALAEPPEMIRADALALARFARTIGAEYGVIVFDGTGAPGGARAAIFKGRNFVEVTENGDRRDLLEQ